MMAAFLLLACGNGGGNVGGNGGVATGASTTLGPGSAGATSTSTGPGTTLPTVATTTPGGPGAAGAAGAGGTTTVAAVTPPTTTAGTASTSGPPTTTGSVLPAGAWGGRGILLLVGEAGATVEYDCAAGTISPPLRLGPDGRFEATGTHAVGTGGPRQSGAAPPAALQARYTGSLVGSQLTLQGSLVATGATIGTFSLTLGQPPLLDRCG